MLGGDQPGQVVPGVAVQVAEVGHHPRGILGLEAASHRVRCPSVAVPGAQQHGRGLHAVADLAALAHLGDHAVGVEHVEQRADDVIGGGRVEVGAEPVAVPQPPAEGSAAGQVEGVARASLASLLRDGDAHSRVGLGLRDGPNPGQVLATELAEPVDVVGGELVGVDRQHAAQLVQQCSGHLESLPCIAAAASTGCVPSHRSSRSDSGTSVG